MTNTASLPQDLLNMLSGFGCLVFEDGHFVYKSGKHGNAYINVDPVLYQPDALIAIAHQITTACDKAGLPVPNVVADPAVGAISFGLMVANQYNEHLSAMSFHRTDPLFRLSSPTQVLHVFADKQPEGTFALERTGFAKACDGKNVLVVEDVLNSGTSTQEVIECVRQAGGNVIGVACFVSRGGVTATDLDVPVFTAVVDINMLQYEASECPLCADNLPVVVDAALGKGQAWRADNPHYPGGFVELLSQLINIPNST